MNKIYENIKAIRQTKGLTQTYLAEKIGIAINNYGKLERGEIQMTIERLAQLAVIFGMTVVEIMQYGGGVESVQVDSEKVKELEREIRDLKKDLEIRDLKLAVMEKVKNDLFYDIMISNIEDMQLIYFVNIFSMQEREEIEKELNIKFSNTFFIEKTMNIQVCQIFSYITDGYDDICLQTDMKDFDTLFPKIELKKYCNFFYENFKMILDFERNLENINKYKNGGNMPTNFGSKNWKIVRRNNRDNYFFEVRSSQKDSNIK